MAAWTVAEIDAIIQALERALATGAQSVTFPDRSSVAYNSPTDLRDAISYFLGLKNEAEADAAGTTPAPRRIVQSPGSGICP